jgi:hypothetical protein
LVSQDKDLMAGLELDLTAKAKIVIKQVEEGVPAALDTVLKMTSNRD